MSAAIAERLPPTTPDLGRDEARPYFVWWTDLSVADFRRRLASPDRQERAYWLGALLREANTRDVWSFVDPKTVRDSWLDLQRHLGRSRAMWAYLLGLDPTPWPPPRTDRA